MTTKLDPRGRKVKILFYGIPAIPLPAWPELMAGTYQGVTKVIDQVDDGKGNFRFWVVPDPDDKPWPPQEHVRQGTKVMGWVILNRVPLWYELLLNSSLSPESKYATVTHELGHLYCGHLGTRNQKWWPDRRELPVAVQEFEAESISYLVCTRLGLETASAEYLGSYVRTYETTPVISLDRVLKSSWLIEQMGANDLAPRTNA